LSNGKISQITEARTPVLFKYLYDKTADLAKYVSTEHNEDGTLKDVALTRTDEK